EATRVRGEQSVELMDARIGCLHASRRALAATTDLLAHADDQVVERADDLVASLPVLGRCGDVHALLDRFAAPPFEQADEVEELRELVATATSFERAGKYDEAAAALAPAIDRAAATAYDPVQTEVNLLLGTIRERQGRYEESEQAHALALQLGLRTGQWDEASRAATALVMTLGGFQRDTKRGLDFAPTAWGLLPRTSAPMRSEAELRRVLGNVYRGAGELERAERELRAALALTLEAPGTDAIDVSGIQLALGSVLELRGDLDGARRELDAAVQSRTEHLGAEHPRTANARHNLAALFAKRGDFAAAEREYRAVLDVLVRAHGPRHPTVAMTRSNLAVVLDGTGHEEEAEAEKREVLEIFVEAYGPDHPHSLSARQNLAVTLGGRNKHAEAVVELRKVIAGLAANSDKDPTIATVRLNLGVELLEVGRTDEGIEELRAGVAMRVEMIGESSLDAAEARAELARALLDHDRAAEALPIARASWATFVKGDGPPLRRAWSAFALARALRATHGDAAEARRLAETARDLLDRQSPARADIEAWLRD
ncbi:MAG TPA: tetratricopeptide repeat protein, partial [Nannocystaceae bacterium]|nr:tetratricopeptide repeat protein [Nannocystaceae bacterium]